MAEFGARLAGVLEDRGPICLGIDPHAYLLSRWGLADSAAGVREFGLRAVDAAAEVIGIVKPQVAFFERHGAAGYAALEEVLALARARGLLTIADVKRGDIGSTVDAYGEAWLAVGSPLEADAMTAVAYQGLGSLVGVLERAAAAEKGVFVLSATSNPEAEGIQQAVTAGGESVAAAIARGVAARNAGNPLGSVGVVIGATVDMARYGIDVGDLASTPVLAPGFGEQGAALESIHERYGVLAGHVIANTGRAMLSGGPDEIAARLRAAVDETRSRS